MLSDKDFAALDVAVDPRSLELIRDGRDRPDRTDPLPDDRPAGVWQRSSPYPARIPSHRGPATKRPRPGDRSPCDNRRRVARSGRSPHGGSCTVPVLATYFSVRRGRDPFFKFFMRTIFPKQVKDYEEKFGIRFIGWYNVAHGWDFDNVILMDLPDYATLDKLEADEATRALGHRAGEWIFERHHSMFLRERMGPDLEYHP